MSESVPEIWAGIECTVNRVGDRYFDQIKRSGHEDRIEDLDRFAELGISAMRYPVLWERVESRSGADLWDWSDVRLARLREMGIKPIVGLLHHGSGPIHTSLIDSRFPALLADYARRCAERYPWVEDWTPINEPLTTARFSGLYGFWHPHGTDDRCFIKALLGQCRGIALAMRAIRAVNPAARLIQTEDLGKTWSTPEIAYQAEFDNHRRWLSFDLLCGRVGKDHPLWGYLLYAGAAPAELEWFLENPTPPDIFGINHYLTSERYLDHRLELFPEATHGGNGKDRYADVEAVRACALARPEGLLREVWQRYQKPIAVTEAHLHCTREEQLRWLKEIWDAACALRSDMIDVRAVTAWAGLGSYDWDSLLTRSDGHYEPGVFDMRSATPRPTAVARLIQSLARNQPTDHPTLAAPGWWRREDRIIYPVASDLLHEEAKPDARPLLITGRNGTLGIGFARACRRRGIRHVATSRADLDVADAAEVRRAIERYRPWAIINAAGYVRVADAEEDRERCLRENCHGPAILAQACREADIPSVTFSSDLVFDGGRSVPYHEGDSTRPLSVYGYAKALGEERVLKNHPGSLIVRTAAFFSPWDPYNFVTAALRSMLAGSPHGVFADVSISPTYVPDLVDTVLDLLIDGESGIWHVVNDGHTTWMELALEAARLAGVDPLGLHAIEPPPFIPRFSAMTSMRSILMQPWQDALRNYWQEAPSAPAMSVVEPV